ncbi:MAG TPA: DUF1501 domain-containing protein [Candidatus Sulfopaludibacter sp.]|jgi:uncharacterized protein (DUF1501 family)|nr:DUF1501 domain-containing protein [Candidatus Sulfopaludibacter sp.]
MLTRRFFVKGSALVMAGAGSVPGWLGRATAATGGRRKTLVVIFQRGAADGLNIVAPFGDKRYAELRPTIGIGAPGKNNGAIDLDGHFGFHPQLEPLKALWDKQQLAVVEATGSPDPSRSHFDAQDFMESGTPGVKSDGWLNRSLPPATEETSPLRAISMGAQLPRTLRGERSAIAVGDVQQFRLDGDTSSILETMYANSRDRQLEGAGKDAFAAMKMIQQLNRGNYTPANGAQYQQGGELGRSLQQVARLIKADAGVEAAFAEIGGWDHHQNEIGQLFGLLRQFGMALAAFSQDMGDRMEDIVLVTMSEFGRTAEENGNNGTDHGHGSVMMVMGGAVRGGKVYGKWPGLEKEQLYEGRDLAVTTDFRAVLSELVSGHLGQKNLAQIFPGYRPAEPLGLLRA